MGNYFTQGLILRHVNFREADRLVSIYTKDRGLVNVVAKGSRKIMSKLAGSLEPFTMAEFMIVNGKTYDTVASSEVVNIYKNIKNDLTKLKLAIYFSKIFLDSVKEMQKDEKIYQFILDIYNYIEDNQSKKNSEINWLIWFFIWHYLKLSGYEPELYKCQICKKDLQPKQLFFNYAKGGLVCNEHRGNADHINPISINTVKVIRTLLDRSLEDMYNIKIDPLLAKEFIGHTKKYFSYIFEVDIEIPFFKSN